MRNVSLSLRWQCAIRKHTLQALAEEGLQAFAQPLTRPELAIDAVQVTVGELATTVSEVCSAAGPAQHAPPAKLLLRAINSLTAAFEHALKRTVEDAVASALREAVQDALGVGSHTAGMGNSTQTGTKPEA